MKAGAYNGAQEMNSRTHTITHKQMQRAQCKERLTENEFFRLNLKCIRRKYKMESNKQENRLSA